MTQYLAKHAAAVLMLLAHFVSPRAMADATISFSGTLISAPICTVNGNNRVEVDFGDNILARRVDGENYRQPVIYTLSCSGVASNSMKMAISGTAAGFGSGLIRTSKEGLAIQLWLNGDKLDNGKAVNFTYPTTPAIYASPVAETPGSLTLGSFFGTASLLVSYQ